MPSEPTDAQARVLTAILDYTMQNSRAPTLRDLGALVGIKSTNGVIEHLIRLEGRGLIVRQARISRSLTITADGWAWWSGVLTERTGLEVSPDVARVMTSVWPDVVALGERAGPTLSGLVDLLAAIARRGG